MNKQATKQHTKRNQQMRPFSPKRKTSISSVSSWISVFSLFFCLLFFSCGTGDGDLQIPGCENCPGRCLLNEGATQGSCVACLTSEHCRSEADSKKRCIENICVCGVDEDCQKEGNAKYCSLKGCTECLVDEHCKNPDKSVCDEDTNRCVPCKPGSTRACSPKGLGVCKKGSQTCGKDKRWSECKEYVVCKNEEMCIEEKCTKDCPETPICSDVERKCTSKDRELPGRYQVCNQNFRGCAIWGTVRRCALDEYCNQGYCIPSHCEPPVCELGKASCEGQDSIKKCIKNDRGCIVWSKKEACKNGLKCNEKDGICGVCKPGTSKSCYSGAKGTEKSLPCKEGQAICKDDASGWGECTGEVVPSKEICNGKDDDCDGEIDEDFPKVKTACFSGKGGCKTRGTYQCNQGQDGVICNAKPTTPGKEECNGKDDDCDGKVDNQGASSLEQSCFEGEKKKLGFGACQAGKQVCEKGIWLSCKGQVLPTAEVCNGKDDDCDGNVDNQTGKSTLLQRPCYSGDVLSRGVGGCKEGTQTCEKGSWGSCNGEVTPTKEECNEKDDDCDGKVDEDFFQKGKECSQGVGFCRTVGSWVCSSDKITLVCDTKAGLPGIEKCNGKDDDCDGQIDNEKNSQHPLKQSCFEGKSEEKNKGLCSHGTQTCSRGLWGRCLGQVLASAEVCDGKDNDCDGQVDEDFAKKGQSCSLGIGECRGTGTLSCAKDGKSLVCDAKENTPTTEVCDGKDNDCDGLIDNQSRKSASPLTETCYTGPANSRGKQPCKDGVRSCQSGVWSSCQGEVKPTTEVCDEKDNDCDGQVDEDFVKKGTMCSVGIGECAQPSLYVCSLDRLDVFCPALAKQPMTEICNGKDDDCDGKTDNQIHSSNPLQKSCFSGQTNVLGKGLCVEGKSSCQSGVWSSCQGEVLPTTEVCDGKDNDCDGRTDNVQGTTNPLSEACYGGVASTKGVGLCQGGQSSCLDGKWSTCLGEITPQKESCDGKDNDCDGAIDEHEQAGFDTVCKECGDKKIGPDEECDDGNKHGRDGCSATCLWELGTKQKPAKNCKEILDAGVSFGDGRYWLKFSSHATAFHGYCNMTFKGGGWTLVAREKANEVQHLAYLDRKLGDPEKISAGTESGIFGVDLQGNYNREYLFVWKEKNWSEQVSDLWFSFQLTSNTDDLFVSSNKTIIGIRKIDSNADGFSALFRPSAYSYSAYFCRANKFGEKGFIGTSWAIRPPKFSSNKCGCSPNDLSWSGQGIFYGGLKAATFSDPSKNTCSVNIQTGGGFTSLKNKGDVKGNITFPYDMTIFVR